jgi:hypothetical protein
MKKDYVFKEEVCHTTSLCNFKSQPDLLHTRYTAFSARPLRPSLMQVGMFNLGFDNIAALSPVARRDFLIADAAAAAVFEANSTATKGVRMCGYLYGAKDAAEAKPLSSIMAHPSISMGTDCTCWHLQFMKSRDKPKAPLHMRDYLGHQVHWHLCCVHDPRHACTLLYLPSTVQRLKQTSVTYP